MRTTVFLLCAALAGVPAKAQVLRFASDGLIASDCAMTVRSLSLPNHVENNPLLGFHPTPARVVAWCGSALALNDIGVRWLVGRRDGNWVWAIVTAAELYAVIHNGGTLGWRVRL